MTCDHIRSLFDAMADDDLDSATRAQVEQHIGGCASCHREWQALAALVHQAAGLPDELTPAHDLWPGIAAQLRAPGTLIDHSSATPRWRTLAPLLAAAVLALAVAAALLWQVGGPTAAGRSASTTVRDANLGAVQAAYDSVDHDLAELRVHLRARVDERRDQLSPATMAVVAENLALIEASILEITAALEDEPRNPHLKRLLLAACRSEVKLLQRVTELPSTVRES